MARDLSPASVLPKLIFLLIFLAGALLYLVWAALYNAWTDIGLYSISIVLVGTGLSGLFLTSVKDEDSEDVSE